MQEVQYSRLPSGSRFSRRGVRLIGLDPAPSASTRGLEHSRSDVAMLWYEFEWSLWLGGGAYEDLGQDVHDIFLLD